MVPDLGALIAFVTHHNCKIAGVGGGCGLFGAGGERVRIVGAPGELLLFLSGRQRVARVQVDGPSVLADRLRTAKLGF